MRGTGTFIFGAGLVVLLSGCVFGVLFPQVGVAGLGVGLVMIIIGLLMRIAGGPPTPVRFIPGPGDLPNPSTHVRCPDCREFVHRDARKCKHCGTALTPQ